MLAPSPSLQAAGVQRWLVVDGQQRLTTLMLAMCALRDHLAAANPIERERINELYLTNRWKSGDDVYRLLPTQADRESFFACINDTAAAGGGDAIGSAYRFFRQALVAADDEDDPYDIERIEPVLRERLAMVEVTAHSDDNVHRIFESLNNTGVGLSQADLLRNYIFMLLPTRAEYVYTTYWLPMQELLRDHLELLIYLDLVLPATCRWPHAGMNQMLPRDLQVGRYGVVTRPGHSHTIADHGELLATVAPELHLHPIPAGQIVVGRAPAALPRSGSDGAASGPGAVPHQRRSAGKRVAPRGPNAAVVVAPRRYSDQ